VTAEAPRFTGGRLNQGIANAVVRRHKRRLGRGPTKAQAFFRHNIVVVVLQDELTDAERMLAEAGDGEAVVRMRERYQHAMRDDLVSAVEELTECRVDAFLAGSHIEPDLVVEVFVLDRPVPGELEHPEAAG
jgi:uncharacterized protein YbcI